MKVTTCLNVFLLCLSLSVSQNIFADEDYNDDPYSSGGDSNDSSSVDDNYNSYNYDSSASQETSADNAFTDSASYNDDEDHHSYKERYQDTSDDSDSSDTSSSSRKLSASIAAPGEQVIIVNPHVHAWGAYTANGKLLRSGLATAGSSWCSDLHRPCRTRTGVFHIFSLGSEDCVSKKFPLGRGGAPMPYCMFFNGGQGIHGSHELAAANISHGCVRISVSDARWIRFNFAHMNTKVIIKPY